MAIYSDERLTEDLKGPGVGWQRRATLLLSVPLKARADLAAEAQTMSNYRGGRPSDNLSEAIATWRAGHGFPYLERARQHREDERALNAALRSVDPGAPRVILGL